MSGRILSRMACMVPPFPQASIATLFHAACQPARSRARTRQRTHIAEVGIGGEATERAGMECAESDRCAESVSARNQHDAAAEPKPRRDRKMSLPRAGIR